MEEDFAKKLVKDVLQHPFEKRRYVYLVRELLNHIKETPETTYRGNYIPDAYKEYVTTLDRIGKYEDPDGKKIDILIVHLKKETSLERARTMQRNFVAWFLKRRGEKDAALAAFISPNQEDWRFSFVKMEYKFVETPKGHKAQQEFTPARRFSFLVGKDETSHTAQKQLVPFLLDDDHCPALVELEEAFSIEKVTKEFFEKYRELFLVLKEALDEIVKKDQKIKTDFTEKKVNTIDFAKKLLGQIVFLYFLQKKGWFGVARGADWGTGPKHFLRSLFEKKHADYSNFFNDILEPLFYEALREDRSHNDDYFSQFKCRIPFLNGGLFDPINEYDWVNTDILLPDELFSNTEKTKQGDRGTGILDVFDRYNFTVKEDEPLEKEVAVDPEMLGKVFENLLEVKDRKSKGTYYTPREIVHYMCQQSLINYLDTSINTAKKPVVPEKPVQEKFFGPKEAQQKSLATDDYKTIVPRQDLEFFIQQGQSALEHDKRVEAEGRETKRYPFLMRPSIRENAEAIDNALKKIRACDPAVGSGAFLVGMMHEIVNARMVLSTYLNSTKNRTPYEFKRHAIQSCLYGVDIDPSAVEIAKLRLWLSLIVDEDDIKNIKPLPNLDYKVVCGNSLFKIEKVLGNLKLFEQLEQLKPLYFEETNVRKKRKFKNQIDDLIHQITNGHEEFDFEVYFSEVFHEKQGFDVVIANPPYVEARSIEQGLVDIYRKMYLTAGNRVNTFALFSEKGISLLNNHGVLSYIIHRNSIRSNDYKKLRKYILDNTRIKNILSFKIGVFENVTGEMTILVLQKTKDNSNNTIKVGFLNDSMVSEINYNEFNQNVFNNLPEYRFNIYLTDEIIKILNKLDNNEKLERFADVRQGIIVGNEKKYVKKTQDSPKYKPILRGRNIFRYGINFNNEYLYYVPGTKVLRRGKTEALFEVPEKILTRHVSSSIIAALDNTGYYYLQTINGVTIKDKRIDYKFLLSLLNSNLINFYYEYTFNMGAEFTTAVAIENLNRLPIRIPSEQTKHIIIAEQILAVTDDDDYLINPAKQVKVKELEKQIDQMVYKLYDLTPEEIAIVEGHDSTN